MGYKNKIRTYTLQFADREGLEIVCKGATTAEIEKMTDLGKAVDTAQDRGSHKLAVLRMYEFFANKVVSWNIEHSEVSAPDENGDCPQCGLKEDDPIPATGQNMLCMELDFATEIITAWITAVVSVALPKGLSLSSGATTGPSSLPQAGIDSLTQRLAELQNPLKLQEPNFT